MKESSGDPRLLAVAAFWPVVCHGSFTLNIVYTPYAHFDADGTLPIQRMKFTRFLCKSQPAGEERSSGANCPSRKQRRRRRRDEGYRP
jgi:hypothetical protein